MSPETSRWSVPLVMQTIDGEFEEWFRATLPRVRGAARGVVGASGDADDIAAEAFARAIVRWSDVRTLPHRDAWVIRVAANLAIDSVRKRARRERLGFVSRQGLAVTQADDEVTDRMALSAAVARLPRRQRETITLRYLVGLPEADVAATLGLSTNTVKTHLARALASLRQALGPQWEEKTLAH